MLLSTIVFEPKEDPKPMLILAPDLPLSEHITVSRVFF
jgi:hypothetical protein